MISPFSMVNGVSTALWARSPLLHLPLLLVVTLWVGGLLKCLLCDLFLPPRGSLSCTWASCEGHRVASPPGMTKARTSMTNVRQHDFPNPTLSSTVQECDAPQISLGTHYSYGCCCFIPRSSAERGAVFCGTRCIRVACMRQELRTLCRGPWHCHMEECSRVVSPRWPCRAIGSLLLALCLGLPGCKTGKIRLVWLKCTSKQWLENKKSLVLLLFSWIMWTKLHRQVWDHTCGMTHQVHTSQSLHQVWSGCPFSQVLLP